MSVVEKSELAATSRITVVEQVYYQPSGGQPYLVESRFSRELGPSEQPYKRCLKVDEEGMLLDCGWIKKCSQLVIVNEEGRNLQVNPTDGEREELRRKVLEVSIGGRVGPRENCWLVLPGESMRGCPSSLHAIYIRSRSGVIRFTLHALPG